MVGPQDLIVQIRAAFRAGQYEVSRHAAVRMLRRAIRSIEIEEAIAEAEIIEKYPDDKYGPGDPIMATKCPVCGGADEATRITFTATIEGSLLTIEEVPALVCRQCGEETFSADTMKRIEALLAAHPRPARVAEVPVYVLGPP